MDIVAVIVSVLAVVVSVYASRKYGDVAGTKAAIKYEEDKEKRERVAALRALLNHAKLCQIIVSMNVQQKQDASVGVIVPFARLPIRAFEEAFVSDKPILSEQEALLEAVNTYLFRAYSFNALVEHYFELSRRGAGTGYTDSAFRKIKVECESLDGILPVLINYLNDALSS